MLVNNIDEGYSCVCFFWVCVYVVCDNFVLCYFLFAKLTKIKALKNAVIYCLIVVYLFYK